MNEIPEGYFRDNDGMLMQGNSVAHPLPQAPQIDPTDVNAVKAMTWAKLVQIASTIAPNDKALPVLREIMDRLDGKPRQQIDTTLTGNMTTTIQIVRFGDLNVVNPENKPQTISGNPPKVIDK